MTLLNYSWERLPEEGNKAFQAFCVYRDFGIQRSLDRVAVAIAEAGTNNEAQALAVDELLKTLYENYK